MQTIMTVATARPVAQPLRVKLNWSSRGLLIRGVRVQLASPALCDYSVVGNTRSFQVRISGSCPDNRLLSACGVTGSRAAFRAQCTFVRDGFESLRADYYPAVVEFGRHAGPKIRCWNMRAGSIPACGTKAGHVFPDVKLGIVGEVNREVRVRH